ncbi:MAG TPA: hypothetical protein VHY08_12790 [Bacillota bacterium]|nr:hypothetical protein [Bacillota bacterium]
MAFSKPKLYLDPSVFVYYFNGDDEDEREKGAVTRRFFEVEVTSGRYEVVSSETVLQTLEKNRNPIPGTDLASWAKSLPITYLPVNDAIRELTKKLAQEGLKAPWEQEAALHLAFALVHQVRYIVSWDHKHMVKSKTKKVLKVMAQKEGVREVRIITPEAVVISGDEI